MNDEKFEITREAILAAAAKCPQAKAILETMFPKAFEKKAILETMFPKAKEEWEDVTYALRTIIHTDSDGSVSLCLFHPETPWRIPFGVSLLPGHEDRFKIMRGRAYRRVK